VNVGRDDASPAWADEDEDDEAKPMGHSLEH
jgi:hypothetical protein